MKELNF